MGNPIRHLFRWLATQLADAGVIDADRGRRTADLAWPRMISGLARKSQQTADLVLVGVAIGPSAIAGLAFAAVYWELGNSLALGLAGGTISQVSRRFGAEDESGLDLAIRGGFAIGALVAIPFSVVYWIEPRPLIGLLSTDVSTATLGSAYLQILGLAMVPNFLNTTASRVLGGVGDTWIPMSIRMFGAGLNVVLNAVLIFWLGMGVRGAALGTLLAEGLVTALFAWGFLGGRLPRIGSFPVTVAPTRPLVDSELGKELVEISLPLVLRRLGQRGARFPLLALVAVFGPATVAAYEIARRIRGLLNTPGWGMSMAASSMVGQALGQGATIEANDSGWDVLRFTMVMYTGIVICVLVFAGPITTLFVQDPEAVVETVPFVRVAAISLFGMGIEWATTGTLKAAGDTRWPLYGRLVGLYVFAIPLAYLGTVTALGILGVYLSLLAERFVPAGVTLRRFQSGRWRAIGLGDRPDPRD